MRGTAERNKRMRIGKRWIEERGMIEKREVLLHNWQPFAWLLM